MRVTKEILMRVSVHFSHGPVEAQGFCGNKPRVIGTDSSEGCSSAFNGPLPVFLFSVTLCACEA